MAADLDTKTYDAHYSMGNYYQGSVATAGSSINIVSPAESATNSAALVDAPDSICPKGWKLPVSGINTVTHIAFERNYSFFKLLRAYQYPDSGFVYDGSVGSYRTLMLFGDLNGASQFISKPPIYNVRAGVIHLAAGSLFEAEYSGSYRSATASTKSNMPYYWSSTYALIFPAPTNNQFIVGTSVRCVVR